MEQSLMEKRKLQMISILVLRNYYRRIVVSNVERSWILLIFYFYLNANKWDIISRIGSRTDNSNFGKATSPFNCSMLIQSLDFKRFASLTTFFIKFKRLSFFHLSQETSPWTLVQLLPILSEQTPTSYTCKGHF